MKSENRMLRLHAPLESWLNSNKTRILVNCYLARGIENLLNAANIETEGQGFHCMTRKP